MKGKPAPRVVERVGGGRVSTSPGMAGRDLKVTVKPGFRFFDWFHSILFVPF